MHKTPYPTLEQKKEQFIIEYVMERASHVKDFDPVPAARKAHEAWNEIQKLKYA